MKGLSYAIAALIISGCGAGAPGLTSEQVAATYEGELAILERLQNDRQELVSAHEKAVAAKTAEIVAVEEKMKTRSSESFDKVAKELIGELQTSIALIGENHELRLAKLDIKISAQQRLVDKAQSIRDSVR